MMLVAVTIAAHYPATHAGYTWDDDQYLYESSLTLARDGLSRIWFAFEAPDYWPLTRTMFWLEWRIWGNNPAPYHATNIVLHAVASLLLWRVLRRLDLREPGAFLAALLFAVHPVTVESVAWISERKNILSLTLYLLSILAYLRAEAPGNRKWYALALITAAGALLAKTSVAMLPVVLLLCGWWKHGSVGRRDVLRSLPFFLLSLGLGLIGIWCEHQNAISGEIVRPEGPGSRIAASGWIVWFYLYKIVIPINLAMVYPRWDVDGGRLLSYVPLALLIGCLALLWYYRGGWARGPLAALAYFLITLAPVLGFIDMSYARFSLVADHLQYVGIPGIIALIGAGLGYAVSKAGQLNRPLTRLGSRMTAAAIVIAWGALANQQARLYLDEQALWTHTIRLNDRAWIAYCNRGNAYAAQGRSDLAIADFTKAIELKPDHAPSYNNRGMEYAGAGEIDRAIADYSKAIEIDPTFVPAYSNRGGLWIRINNFHQAIKDSTRAIELDPACVPAYSNRGGAYVGIGEFEMAVRDCTKAIELNPNYAHAYGNRALAYFRLKQYDRTLGDLRRCQELGTQPNPELLRALKEEMERPQ